MNFFPSIAYIRLLAFWLLWFMFGRLLFVGILTIYGMPFPNGLFQAFVHALRLDISMASYCMLLPWLLLPLLNFLKGKWQQKLFHWLSYLFIVLTGLIAVLEVCVYTEWKSKLNAQAVTYLTTADELAKSAGWGMMLALIFLILSVSTIGIFMYRYVVQKFIHQKADSIKALPFFSQWLVFTAFVLVGIRGGLQTFPISRSDAVFSTQPILNDVAVNPTWNLAKDCLEYFANNLSNPYIEMTEEEAKTLVRDVFSVQKDTTEKIFRKEKPNIVFIMLESWSAYCSKSLGGDDFTPNFDKLSAEGLLFNRCYSNGYISDQGVPAILSSQPCTRKMSLINQAQKAAKIPCINEYLEKEKGYTTGFIFGGDLNFGDMKSYIYGKKFGSVMDNNSAPKRPNNAQLGVNDWEMAEVAVEEISKAKAPFFQVWYTLSSHSPFDIPEPIQPLVDHTENKYVNSVRFSDKAIGRFFELAKKQPWYSNTVFVLVADHSHYNQRSIEPQNMEYHRIPFLVLGDVLKPEWKGKKWEKVVSQLDITPSVLHQLDISSEDFVWGKNIFNPYTKPSAFFTLHFGSGLVEEEGFVSFAKEYSWHMDTDIKEQARQDVVARRGKAIQQEVYEDYLRK